MDEMERLDELFADRHCLCNENYGYRHANDSRYAISANQQRQPLPLRVCWLTAPRTSQLVGRAIAGVPGDE